MIGNIENFIEQKQFFKPTPTLARAIVRNNQMLVSQPLQTPWDDEELDLEEDEGLDDSTTDIDSTMTFSQSPAAIERDSGEYESQRIISERLYHFLASMTESPYARDGGRFPLWEVIPGGMSTMLGMPPDSNLMRALVEEFRKWLRDEQRGRYKGPWWEVVLDDDEALVLKEIASKQDYLRNLTKRRNAFAAASRDAGETS